MVRILTTDCTCILFVNKKLNIFVHSGKIVFFWKLCAALKRAKWLLPVLEVKFIYLHIGQRIP